MLLSRTQEQQLWMESWLCKLKRVLAERKQEFSMQSLDALPGSAADLLCDLGQVSLSLCLPSTKLAARHFLPTVLTEALNEHLRSRHRMLRALPHKQKLVNRKVSYPATESTEVCQWARVIPGHEGQAQKPRFRPTSQCPCLSTGAEEGMSELSGPGGYRWSLAEWEGGANQRRSAPQLELEADGSEAAKRGTSQFLSLCQYLVVFKEGGHLLYDFFLRQDSLQEVSGR